MTDWTDDIAYPTDRQRRRRIVRGFLYVVGAAAIGIGAGLIATAPWL